MKHDCSVNLDQTERQRETVSTQAKRVREQECSQLQYNVSPPHSTRKKLFQEFIDFNGTNVLSRRRTS